MYGFHRFYLRLFLLLVLVVSSGIVRADIIQHGGASVPGSPNIHAGYVEYTITEDGQGGAVVLCTVGTASYYQPGGSEEITDARLGIAHPWGGGQLAVGQSTTLPLGTEITLWPAVPYAGWHNLGPGRVLTLGSAVYKVAYNWSNNTAWEARVDYHKVLAGGGTESEPSHSIPLSPGETAIGEFIDQGGPNTYTVWVVYEGIEEFASLGWVTGEENETKVSLGEVDPESVADSSTPATPANSADLPSNAEEATAPPDGQNQTGQTTGATEFTVGVVSNPGGGLTNAEFARGVAQIVNQVRRSGGGGGSTGSTTVNVNTDALAAAQDETTAAIGDTNEALADIDQTLSDYVAEREALREAEVQAFDETPGNADRNQAGSSAGTTLSNLIPDTSVIQPLSDPPTSPIDFSISLPATMGGITIDADPFRADRLGPVISWFRGAVAWLTLAIFGVWVFQETKRVVMGVPLLSQAKGNAVVGGTGGQATAFAAAAIITATMATAVVGIVGFTFGDISFNYLTTIIASNPMAGMPAQSAWMLLQVFPVMTMIAALVGRITFNTWVMFYYSIAAAVIKFVTP